MGTKRFFTLFATFQFFAIFSASAQITAHGEFPFDVISANNEVKTLTAGYDSRATDGIDSSFGEIQLPPYTPNQFDARFRLPDSITTTYKDFRAGCNFFAAANYIVEWVNSQRVTITSNHLSSFVTYVKFINIANETVLAEFWSPDSIYFQTPIPSNQIKVSVLYMMALSYPRSNFYSPQGGDVLHAGSVVDIKFNFWYGSPVQNDLFLSTDNGASWEYFGTTPNRSDTSYSWTVPSINSNKCKIRVGDYPCYYAENSGTFVVSTTQYTPLDGFELPMQFSSGNKTIGLIAGIHPDATNGLDSTLGEIPLTQVAVPDSFDARFLIVDKLTSLKDFKKGDRFYYGPKRYKILLQKKANDTCTIRFTLKSGVQAQLNYSYKVPYGLSPKDTIFKAGDIEYNITEDLFYNEINLYLFFDGTVPVELTSFEAKRSGKSVLLQWETATETNNLCFEIERKIVGKNIEWQSVGFAEGKGTTTYKSYYSYVDKVSDINGNVIVYRLKQTNYDGSNSYSQEVEVNLAAEKNFSLSQNYPNPFNPVTTINYSVPELGLVNITVFDVLGRKVKTLVNTVQNAGEYSIPFDASKLSGGIYYYRMTTNRNAITRKMILLK
ncbi:MAG: T9SS type A sorting domain-containing protein [Ignavibacteriaceae bacterium]|nr:T9SS type A sorting domain-containing protein [Ignavibacteriaceae bacterium]